MKVNTVTITLGRLKALELAEKKVNEPRSKTIIIEQNWVSSLRVETDDECVEKLANTLKKKEEEIKKLANTLKKKEEEIKITIDDVKKMNYWDFRKWKRRRLV